ncbi:hypothetical protein ACFQ7B_38005, partial [Streptomyces erythrochromogenes]
MAVLAADHQRILGVLEERRSAGKGPVMAKEIAAELAPWRKPRAVHDPGKVLLDVALAVALGGD